MKNIIIKTLFILLFFGTGFSQTNVWIKVEKGTVLNLDPSQMQWVPVSEKQQLHVKSFLITKTNTQASIFKNTDVYELPQDAYFFVHDIFQKSRMEIVSSLTQIEAGQLPDNTNEPGEKTTKAFGLTYGRPQEQEPSTDVVPNERERLNAVNWFYEHNQSHAALLSLKRMMTKFPLLYLKESYVERLLTLYKELLLYGFLLDESSRLLALKKSKTFNEMLSGWHQLAKKKLLDERSK